MGVGLDRLTEEQTVAATLNAVRDGRGGWICPINLDVLRQVVRVPEVRALVEHAEIRVGDGMPLLWASRLQGTPLPERVAGSSLIHTIPRAASASGASVFLLGGDEGVARAAAERLRNANPGLRIAGTHCPPFGFEDDPRALAAIEHALDEAQPDLIFVGLGFPKQEKLIARLRPRLPASWWISCGISFSYVTGHVTRAPNWVQRAGLEWIHRLVQEPRRLARRYLIDGIPFSARMLLVSGVHRLRALRW
jgi:N-acetylglucosaminyldiphosphoundecaprenol N-acetyl-beta-D-mannosaminyltransferase